MKSLHPSLVFPCNSIVIFILLFSLFHFAVAQNKIYVNASAKGNNDGSSWLHAFSDLQDALALASLQPQKIIYVAEGTYYPTPGINRDISFVIPPYTKLIGGFDSKNKSASISDPNKHPTILSGDLGDFGPSNHVVKAYTNFCINGFIIQEGYGGESGKERHGGGLFIDNQINEDLPQTDSIIKCRFINNDANNGDGGGVYIENGKVGFYQVEFWDNRSRGDGGAVVVRGDYSDISFEEAIFRFNQSESEEGGAIAAFGKKVTISYSEFYANSSTQGGAIYGGKNNILEINNCTFFQNDARRGNGGALRVRGTGFLKHSILWEKLLLSPISLDQNEFSVTFSLIHQGFPGQGNFSSDPLFLNEAFPDLRLSKNSPAINAGDTPGVDLGAYPYTEILDSLPSYSSGIIFVDSSATGNNNGSSWENAFNDLQDALTVAESGNQIWVATGTYYPVSCNPCYWWDLERSFELVNGVEIYGGFRGDELKLENRGTDSVSLFHINPTILSGNLYRVEDTSIGSYTVLYLEGVDPTSLLSGFIIEESFSRNDEGINVDNRSFSGGGIYNLNSSPRIELCIIKDNFGDLLGSGMANFNSSPIISDCVFLRNWTEREGGAIYNFNSSPQIINCKFLWNVGDDSGGGISNVNSSPEIRNCIFFRNYGTDGGGAISNVDSSPKIFNCNFTSNRSWLHGAGFQNINSPVYIENCEFYDNSAIDFGGGIYNSGSSPTITRCFFQGNNSSLGGGGIANLDGSFSIIDNCTFNANYSIFEGGGIANYSSSSTIDNCTFFHNEADFSEDSPRPDNGGGIFSQGGRLSISNSTICYNGDNGIFLSEGDTLSITNSLLAFNEVADIQNNGALQSLGHNLFRDSTGISSLLHSTDLIGNGENPIDPLIDTLSYFKGTMPTIGLLKGSPAIGKGPPTNNSSTLVDQRGYSRVVGSLNDSIDIGAFEYQETHFSQPVIQFCHDQPDPQSLGEIMLIDSTGGAWAIDSNQQIVLSFPDDINLNSHAIDFEFSGEGLERVDAFAQENKIYLNYNRSYTTQPNYIKISGLEAITPLSPGIYHMIRTGEGNAIQYGNSPSDSSSLITIWALPSVQSFPYDDSFEETPIWQAELSSPLWQWGEPADTRINTASDGQKVFMTNLQGSYDPNMQAMLYSPCLDVSSLTNPTLSFDFWADMEPQLDGTVLQYSLDNGHSWRTLGTDSTGRSWYNSSSILANPAQQPNTQQLGWTSATDGWRKAIHRLPEELKQEGMRLRFVFGSFEFVNPIDQFNGFAIDNLSIADYKKNILGELFVQKADELTPSLATLQNTFGDELITISYPLFYPTTEVESRNNFYGKRGENALIMDGQSFYDPPSLVSYSDIDSLSLVETSFGISYIPNDPRPLQVKAFAPIPQEVTIQTIFAEKRVVFEEDTLRNVVRKFFPDPAGESIANLKEGETLTLNPFGEEDLLSSLVNNKPDDFQLIVFLQDAINKRIYQAEAFPLSLVTSISDSFNQTPSLKVYPNPVSDKLYISIPHDSKQEMEIQVWDLQGRSLLSQSMQIGQEVNVENLADGMYILSIQSGTQKQIVKPFLIQR